MTIDVTGDADLALQKALFEKLAGDAGVTALVGARLHDNPPGDVTFPYLTLGEAQVDDWSDDGQEGAEHRLSLYVFSRVGGRAEAKAVMGAVNAALHDAALTLEGHRLINLRFQSAETRQENDGATWRGTIRFRAVTEKIN
ncbi:MAG: DUF3168 domain-containing protein [Parvibaculum sp.]